MTSADLLKLLRHVIDNRLKASYEIVEGMTIAEREVLAQSLDEASLFLRRVNKEWKEALDYPAKNEE